MEFIIPTSIVSILVGCLLAFFVILQVIIDAREARQSRRLHREMIAIAKKHNEKTISIVVELAQNAETIIPLLDHLYGFKYDKLEVIVVIEPNADKNIRLLLNRYRRTNHVKRLRIVQHSRELKLRDVLRRYSSGELVMILNSDERLSHEFFEIASTEALNKEGALVVLPRRHIRLENTVASALQAQISVMRQLIRRLFRFKMSIWPLRTGVVYNRQSIIADSEQTDTANLFVSQRLYVSDFATTRTITGYIRQSIKNAALILQSWRGIISSIVIVGIVVLFSILLDLDEQLILIACIIGIYTFTSMMMQMRTKGYSLIDNINLVLIAPFSLVYILVIYICGFVRMLTKSLGR